MHSTNYTQGCALNFTAKHPTFALRKLHYAFPYALTHFFMSLDNLLYTAKVIKHINKHRKRLKGTTDKVR